MFKWLRTMLGMVTGGQARQMNLHSTDSGESSKSGQPEPRLVIAIDFGTFASGYALQWRSDYKENPLKIYFNKKWGENANLCTYKTPTCLLLRPDKSVCEFGYRAEIEYYQLGSNDSQYKNEDPNKWYLFRQFKMMLYNREDLSDDTPIEGVNGKNLTAIEVFSKSIQYMKDHVIKRITDGGVPYPENETKWVITVPAIWDETAKLLMTRAAVKAGIRQECLIISLESECAAMYCSQVSEDQMKISGDGGKLKYIAAPGSTIMVADIGGGTVDMTTVQINTGGTMKQVYCSEGGPWGGKHVDDKFFAMIRDLVSEEVMVAFRRENPEEEYEMRMDFETQKRKVTHPATETTERFRIRLPINLKLLWEEKERKSIVVIMKDLTDNGSDIMFTRGRLSFKMDIIRNFFQETISEIQKNVVRVLGTPQHSGVTLDSLILVGGFAESDFVVQSLRDGLKNMGIPVVRPESTELAVINGAVLYGQDEKIMASRKLQWTYGVGMVMEFNQKKHLQDNKFEDGGKLWANNVFRKHVVRGQEVQFDEWTSGKTYFPVDKTQRSAMVYVYSSDKEDPVHTTEKGCKCIGTLKVPFSNDRIGESRALIRAVEVAFKFGGTMLSVKAIDKTSEQQFEIKINLQ